MMKYIKKILLLFCHAVTFLTFAISISVIATDNWGAWNEYEKLCQIDFKNGVHCDYTLIEPFVTYFFLFNFFFIHGLYAFIFHFEIAAVIQVLLSLIIHLPIFISFYHLIIWLKTNNTWIVALPLVARNDGIENGIEK